MMETTTVPNASVTVTTGVSGPESGLNISGTGTLISASTGNAKSSFIRNSGT